MVSEESVRLARARALEAAVLTLQQAGDLTMREAAGELGLSYEGYPRLLSERGLPACYDDRDNGSVDAARALLGLAAKPR